MKHYHSHTYAASLAGKFLIASPYCMLNSIFDKSLIYLASHSHEGAIGVIVNHVINNTPVNALLGPQQEEIEIKRDINVPVYLGGPVEAERGFIVHSSEYDKNTLLKLENDIYISSSAAVVNDVSNGQGPLNKLFVMGYTAWTPGQLEQELLNNFWLVADYNEKLLYNTPDSQKWSNALHQMGVDEMHFSSLIGNS